MAGFHTDVQALLEDISNDYGEITNETPSLRQSRSNTDAYHPHIARSMYATQALRLHDTYHHDIHDSGGLDAYDRALLTEPSPRPLWQSSNVMNGGPAGRLSLPGHTAQYVYTPPAQMNASSPLNDPHSSPSMRIRERHVDHASRTLTLQARESPSPYRSQFNPFVASNRKRNLQITDAPELPIQPPVTSSSPSQSRFQPRLELSHAPPIVQGVQLVSLNELPDRLRTVFRHPLFNAIQSKCFAIAYKSNDNLVVSAPTGGGKTAILEMAICRLVSGFRTDQYKIVYMAPTKSLCSERQRDWQVKFAALDLHCAELTGDTEHGQLRNVQSASIVITTPEKWDSMTRKWKDHAKLMQMVKLFLIDEVHILKDTRGATLEAVVSRMKSVGSSVRFVALSATVPNSEDIATWLGKDSNNPHLPAPREKFGEEFRPVRLQKHVIGLPYKGNDFGFERACDPKLPEIIFKYSHKKPIMIFCITRSSTVNTARLLANMWASRGPRDRYWEGPTQRSIVQDPELKSTLLSGVAFHHAGLDSYDRHAVEKGFLEGQINVICCTSTLAVGVNLPCHMVIIKNTMSFTDDGLKEYADLEIMQMLGRAGRPQFDATAIAVIITKQEKAKKYEKLVSGEELLESCLHLNLIDHLNAEIGLGTIYDLYTAKRWLAGTFLYVRLGQNPDHYKLDEDAIEHNLDDRIERICRRDLALLEDSNLVVSSDARLKSTELGDAMARYYVQFKTMQVLLQLGSGVKMSDILSTLVQANEFQEIRLKAAEKKLFKELNRANGIKYPIKVDIAMPAHKRSLIVQAELGGVDFPTNEQYAKLKRQYIVDKGILFSHIHRLVSCLIDCQIHLQDAVTLRHALELGRSLSARVWDNSPYEMRQIAQIGLVAIRKLAIGGINSIEALEAAEPHRIEMLMSKNPPFGQKLLDKLKDFPKLRVSIKMMGKNTRKARSVTVKIKAECGFMNDKTPTIFNKRPIYVCLLTERSDGHLIDFRRISAKNLSNGQDILMSAQLLNHTQYITCYVVCEAVAGTLRYAEFKPGLPAHMFPPPRTNVGQQQHEQNERQSERDGLRVKRTFNTSPATLGNDEFAGNEIDDQDLVDAAAPMDFNHIDHVDMSSSGRTLTVGMQDRKDAGNKQAPWNPEKLANGKWACNHKCKDKTVCKHFCCRDGVDKAPKPPKNAFVSAASFVDVSRLPNSKSNTGSLSSLTKVTSLKKAAKGQKMGIETVDLADQANSRKTDEKRPRSFQDLQRLHDKAVKDPAILPNSIKPSHDYIKRDSSPELSNSSKSNHWAKSSDKLSTDYDNDWMEGLPSSSAMLPTSLEQQMSTDHGGGWCDDLPSPSALLREHAAAVKNQSDTNSLEDFDLSQFNDDDDKADVEAALVGLSDSVTMNEDVQAQVGLANVSQSKTVNGLQRSEDHVTSFATAPRTQSKTCGASAPSKLFSSTERAEESMEAPFKRKSALVSGTPDLSLSAPVPKRPRLDNQTEPAIQSSSKVRGHAARPTPVIRPGQPAWVYDFDPKFIAEWQDIVEFI